MAWLSDARRKGRAVTRSRVRGPLGGISASGSLLLHLCIMRNACVNPIFHCTADRAGVARVEGGKWRGGLLLCT